MRGGRGHYLPRRRNITLGCFDLDSPFLLLICRCLPITSFIDPKWTRNILANLIFLGESSPIHLIFDLLLDLFSFRDELVVPKAETGKLVVFLKEV